MKFRKCQLSIVFILLTTTVFINCNTKNGRHDGKYYTRKTEPSFTIYGWHEESTGSLDIVMDNSGTVIVPSDLKIFFGDTLKQFDLILAGNYPYYITDVNSWFHSSGIYKYTGKIIDTQATPYGDHMISPVFYVEKCSKFRKQRFNN